MRQLDEQVHSYTTDLLPIMQKYMVKRKKLAASIHGSTSGQNSQMNGIAHETESQTSHTNGKHAQETKIDLSSAVPIPVTPFRRLQMESRASPRTPTPMDIPPERTKTPETSREMLSHIAWLSEELLRASQEKVNLAQTAHDSVDRHVRLLDLAIKEQELALSLESSGNSIALMLPDLSNPPRRSIGTVLSSVEDEEGDNKVVVEDEAYTPMFTADHAPTEESEELQRRKKGRKRQPAGRKSLKLILPASGTDGGIDPNEERYCVCNSVSFGEMIACDDANCAREWFHLGCVGLTKIPEGKWFCDECKATRKRRSSRV
ncbi:hypothetical protein BDQ12DRAFT_676851 [Crucibulum laeve]|uniref:Chromatin modification-related protein n=1 Tax=Crucibulum laeve TaxID=68775 RepID=A0A5C3MDV5_9AGAR|nr:hypothetical protein BDQ12DRAFT_676851 [Crucibulum laeve]